MHRLPIAERRPTCQSQGRGLLQSIAGEMISAAIDANLIVVLIVFTAVCLLALNLNLVAPDATLAMRQFGPSP